MATKKNTPTATQKVTKSIAKKAVAKKKATVATAKPVAPPQKKETAIISSPFWNIWDTGTQYKVRLSIPGLSKKNIKVQVDDHYLTISGKKEQESKTTQKNFVVQEYSYDSWSKSAYLPAKVNAEDMKVSYKDGILKITLDKLKASK